MNYEELSKDELIEIIKENEEFSGKYGLIWDKEKEPEFIVVDCDKNIPILEEVLEKTINNGMRENILIEGDNFHSLSVLNYTHNEKVDVIYIDPPYNTGNNDFIYNDKFVDPEDGYRHSKWLNFMTKRLKLSKKLLKEDGFIFISIGDDEFAQLKLLCDKIFGAYNFVTNFMWIQTSNPPSLGKIRNNLEYVVCYQNRSNNIKLYGRSSNEKDSPLANAGNNLSCITIPKGTCEFPNVEGSLTINAEQKNSGVNLLDDVYIDNNYNTNDFRVEFHSKWGQENVDKETANGTKFIIKDSNYFSIRYQKGAIGFVVPDKFLDPTKFDVKDNEYGRKQLEELVGKGKFTYPKNTPLIKTLINMVAKNKKDAVILDFFAGSGTTGQAVLELNKEDGGNRQFILCTNNENNICEDVTYPRLERAINGYNTFESLGGSLKYYKCKFVENSNNRDQLYFDLTEKCIPMLCVKDENYIEYKSTDEYVIYTNKDNTKYSCVYYSLFGEKEEEFINLIENLEGNKSIYKFALGDDLDLSLFKNVKDYNIEPIPYKIVELYKRIVKLSREED